MRILLSEAYGINLRNAPKPRIVNGAMRFITGDGIFDCIVVKEPRMRVLAMSVVKRS
jgi:hypothetical protein